MAHEETVYEALDHAHGDEGHWAFGTGFDEPLAGVDTTVPDGVDPAELGEYCLMLGDDALVLAQRLTQWVTAAPSSRRRSRSPTWRSTCSARPGCCWPAPARSGCSAGRELATESIPDEDALAYFRDADEFRSTALVAGAQRRLRADDGPAAGRVHRAARGLRPAARVARPGARRDRRQGRATSWPTTATTPPAGCCASATAPRSRTAAPRRRRRGLAAARRGLHRHGRRDAADRGRRRRRPGDHPRRGARGAHPGARARDADRAGWPADVPRAAASASTARSWPSCSAGLQGLARQHPAATW